MHSPSHQTVGRAGFESSSVLLLLPTPLREDPVGPPVCVRQGTYSELTLTGWDRVFASSFCGWDTVVLIMCLEEQVSKTWTGVSAMGVQRDPDRPSPSYRGHSSGTLRREPSRKVSLRGKSRAQQATVLVQGCVGYTFSEAPSLGLLALSYRLLRLSASSACSGSINWHAPGIARVHAVPSTPLATPLTLYIFAFLFFSPQLNQYPGFPRRAQPPERQKNE